MEVGKVSETDFCAKCVLLFVQEDRITFSCSEIFQSYFRNFVDLAWLSVVLCKCLVTTKDLHLYEDAVLTIVLLSYRELLLAA
jgi:hypothetical protein